MWKPPSPTCKWSLSTYIIYFIYYLWWFSCRLMSCLSLDALRFSLISKYVWSNYLQFPFHFIDLQMWLSGGKLFSLAYYMSGQTICNFQFTSSLWTEKFLAERGHFDPWACLGLAAKISKMSCCDKNFFEFLQIQILTIERRALALGEIVSYLAKDVTDTPASRT